MTGRALFAIPEQLTHLIPAYCTELDRDSTRLKDLLAGDAVELAEHAHAMGGKCAMFGDGELAEMLYEIEREAPHASQKVLTILARAVLDRVDSVLAVLKASSRP